VSGSRSALIVACDGYADAGLGRLRAPASDARALAGVLQDPAIGGFDVRTLMNAPAYEVALGIEEFFADRVADDLLLLHLSCHGVKDEDGELYFAMANTALRRLAATGVAAEFVNRRMNRSRSRRVILLLDCCYAGAFERGMTARAGAGVGIESQFGGRGRAVITASSAMEYAFEGDELADSNELAPSVFTSALVQGLQTGDADRDQDGLVSLDELYDYIYDKVRATTPNQTPGKWVFGVQGELVIARRARPVTQPAPLPPEVQEAIDSPLAAVRNAAVLELSRLLRGKHAGRALAAQQALEELTRDDSRSVAAAAAEALSTLAAPEPAGTEPAQPEPARPEPAEPQPAKPKPAEPEPAQPELAEPELAEPELTMPVDVPEPETVDEAEHGEHEKDSSTRSAAKHAAGQDGAAQEHRAEPELEPPTAEPQQPCPEDVAQPVMAASAKGRDLAPRQRADGLLIAAGLVAIVGAVVLLISVFPTFLYGSPLSASFANTWQNVLEAVAAGVAGCFLLVHRTRSVIGPGFLFGAIATAPSGGVYDVLVGKHYDSLSVSIGPGLPINFVACIILTVAGGMVWRTVAKRRLVHVGRRAGILPWLVVFVGLASAVLLVGQVLNQDAIAGTGNSAMPTDLFALYWTAVMALVLPTVAVFVAPPTFGVALLAGWLMTGIAEALFYASAPKSYFLLTLIAMLAVTIAYAATALRKQSEVGTDTTSQLA
jgi:caspase domain-containing protein